MAATASPVGFETSFQVTTPPSSVEGSVLLIEEQEANTSVGFDSVIEDNPTSIQTDQPWKAKFTWRTTGVTIQNMAGQWELKLILHPMEGGSTVSKTDTVVHDPANLTFEVDGSGNQLANTLSDIELAFNAGDVGDGVYHVIGQIGFRVQSGHMPLCGFVDLGLIHFYGDVTPIATP